MNQSPKHSRWTFVVYAIVASVAFYGAVFALQRFSPTRSFGDQLYRYFAGHPICYAETIMFFFGLAILWIKTRSLSALKSELESLRDEDLAPPPSSTQETPANQWRSKNDAGHVARHWLASLKNLPASIQSTGIYVRLSELLSRQCDSGTSLEYGTELREMADRQSDAAYESLALVRIIAWAIPMLGFLGTVVGITQTLGDLDFSNGTKAVDSLKTGLNVAFDTTAIGLVFSVLTIFLQHPLERKEGALLGEIENRVARLAGKHLPSGDTSDNQTEMIAQLCSGVQAAVSQSLNDQARLWRQTIDEARDQWQSNHQVNNQAFINAFEVSLIPALKSHASGIHDREIQQQAATLAMTNALMTSVDSLADRLTQHRDAIADQEPITDAMVILARAVDRLSKQMPASVSADEPASLKVRRAA
jgi:biopolymer transport protein ExbB/TolQ